MPQGVEGLFSDLSIVGIGFMGTVLREFYRISLVDGTTRNIMSGEALPLTRS